MGMAVPPEALILGRCSVWGNKVKNTEQAAYFARRLTGAQKCANQNNNHKNLTFVAHYSPRTHQLVFVLTQQRSSHIVEHSLICS